MSLNGAMNIGRTALNASQAALQVAGQNMANAATEGYHRRTVSLAPLGGDAGGRGVELGRGVQLLDVRRTVDVALQARYRDALSAEQDALTGHRLLSTLEGLQNELTDLDLSTALSDFFNAFSGLANAPNDPARRGIVVEEGARLAGRIADTAATYRQLAGSIERELDVAVGTANDLLGRIADLDRRITVAEAGVTEASALRDQRDLLLDELATYVPITVIEGPNGRADVLVDSVPVVLAGESRGLEFRIDSTSGAVDLSVRVAADGTQLRVSGGQVGALLRQAVEGTPGPSLDTLDQLAGSLIEAVNRVHAQGQPAAGFARLTGLSSVGDTGSTLNAGATDLPFALDRGSFFLHVTNEASGLRTAHRIDVDPATQSLEDLAALIDGTVPEVTARVTPQRTLELTAAAGTSFTFSEDTSGVLAALGLNVFFTGRDAASIDVAEDLRADPSRLAVGLGHVSGSNGTALALAALQDEPLEGLGGTSVRDFWRTAVGALAVASGAAERAAESAGLVRESLDARRQQVSGVSLDEEAIDLLTHQRQFQAAARFIATIDEAMQTLLELA